MAREISNHDDVIDSRDALERLEELDALKADDPWGFHEYDESIRQEHNTLRDLNDEGSREVSDWQHGATLIRDSYFREYAQELAEDIGALPSDAGWPAYCIDWERAARDLRMDYTSIEFDGVTYWARS